MFNYLGGDRLISATYFDTHKNKKIRWTAGWLDL